VASGETLLHENIHMNIECINNTVYQKYLAQS